MSARRIAALDIGGTNIKACLFYEDTPCETQPVRACNAVYPGTAPVASVETPTEARMGAAHMMTRVIAVLEKLYPFDVIGVSTAGQVDPEKGTIRYANDNIPGYTGMDVRGILSERFRVPVVVVNDAYAAALGEGVHGAAKGERDYLCLTYGTGIGSGVVLDGKIYYGTGASAGVMLGGLILHPEKVCAGDPFSGTYERFASASALVRMGMAADPLLNSGRAIFSRMEEPRVRALVDHWLDEVAAGLCSLIHIYNVPHIVLGGGVMEQPYAIDGVRTRTLERLIRGFCTPRIEKASLGNMAGLYGAAELAKQLL